MRLFLAAFGCYAAAVILDFFEGEYDGYEGVASFFDVEYETVGHYSRVVEEVLEDWGASLLLIVLLRHLLYTVSSFRVTVAGGPSTRIDWEEWPSEPKSSS